MALYYDAAAILSSHSTSQGSLRSRIYDSNANIKSSPSLVFALVAECAKWDVVLSEVIDYAGILSQEPKLTPVLALLLVHDQLLSRRGIACPQNHPLRLAVERHKARLASELTKARLRRKFATLEDLRSHLRAKKQDAPGGYPQPRWIRINNLKTSLDEEMRTTFSNFTECSTLEQLFTFGAATKAYVSDPNIPNVLATNVPTKDIIHLPSYETGKIILQDKASCFPAHLALKSKLNFSQQSYRTVDGDFLDACAAPGNKTSHVASIFAKNASTGIGKATSDRIIFACERDAKRAGTLQSMLDRAGAHSVVQILPKQDFLALDPQDERFSNVTHLLLDPSCSGSGILSREDVPNVVLPRDTRRAKAKISAVLDGKAAGGADQHRNKKRKRNLSSQNMAEDAEADIAPKASPLLDTDRLQRLSNLQTKIVEHAFTFPSAKLVTYSTCSVHATENEMVVSRALVSAVARRRSWRLLRRDEQPDGLRVWPHRGVDMEGKEDSRVASEGWSAMTKEERMGFREACIRCKPGGADGTMGFFVVGFVRDPGTEADLGREADESDSVEQGSDEWEGFSTDEES